MFASIYVWAGLQVLF